jgi:beta-lactamase regulating signal transducer with metallopeptidase domain
MELDLSSYFSASLALMLLLFVARFIIQKTAVLLKFGIIGVYAFVILVLIRGYLPVDFSKMKLTTSYYSHNALPFLRKIIYTEINVGRMFLSVRQILIIVLVMGWMLITYKKIYGYFVFKKFINSVPFCHNADMIKICKDTFYTIFPSKKKYNIKIIQANIFSSPAIFVSSYPIIILPDILYTEKELEYVFYHELIHLKHHDFLIKMAAELMVAAYWWNPFISKSLFGIISQIQELYVDYEIDKELTKKERLVYLKVISKTVDHIYNDKTSRKHIYALADGHSLNMLQRVNCITSSQVNGLTLKGIIFSIILFVFSFRFVFEPSVRSTHDELGDKVFYGSEESSYYVWDGTNYSLYISGECVCTTSKIHEDLKNLPVYKEEFR